MIDHFPCYVPAIVEIQAPIILHALVAQVAKLNHAVRIRENDQSIFHSVRPRKKSPVVPVFNEGPTEDTR